MTSVKAHWDGKQVILDQPLDLQPDTPLLVNILDEGVTSKALKEDPVLMLSGLGREIWEGIDPDEYVRQQREGWE
jgi:hypothetical protein